MSNFYNRQFEILLDDKQFIIPATGRQFKVLFSVIQDFGAFNSFADISIFNLSTNTINKFLKRDMMISLRAGYADSIDYIFKGQIRNVFPERQGPDVLTRVIAASNYNPNVTVSQTIGKNCSIVEIIKACAAAMSYPLVMKEEDFQGVSLYPRGYVLHGDPKVYLDSLARVHNFSWIIESGRLVVVHNAYYRESDPYVVSVENGMEGIPEVTEIGCDVTIRLSPKLKIGGLIDVRSNYSTFNFSNLYYQDIPEHAGKGIYKIFKIQHSGDSWGDEWSTRITGIRPNVDTWTG